MLNKYHLQRPKKTILKFLLLKLTPRAPFDVSVGNAKLKRPEIPATSCTILNLKFLILKKITNIQVISSVTKLCIWK